jgi:hypothetical protein
MSFSLEIGTQCLSPHCPEKVSQYTNIINMADIFTRHSTTLLVSL